MSIPLRLLLGATFVLVGAFLELEIERHIGKLDVLPMLIFSATCIVGCYFLSFISASYWRWPIFGVLLAASLKVNAILYEWWKVEHLKKMEKYQFDQWMRVYNLALWVILFAVALMAIWAWFRSATADK